MKFNSIFVFLYIILAGSVYAQTKDSIDIVPYWKTNESFLVNIKSTTYDTYNGKKINYLSTFQANFLIKEASDTAFKVEWSYTNAKLAANDPLIENQLAAKLLNTKLLIKLSQNGQFVELLNSVEVKEIADKAIDELISKTSSDLSMKLLFKVTKELIASKRGLEAVLLKQIKFYHLLYGFNYKSNFVETHHGQIANPFGGEPFDAVEKVQVTNLDRPNSVCTITSSKTVDGKAIKDVALKYIKKVANPPAQVIIDMNKAKMEVAENTMHQIDLSKGVVQKSAFLRTLNFGFQSRLAMLEMETIIK